ncbi:MAG: hypothetical protein COA99_14930 [Moraxellaceae bacterium]|nr:MAG: hypothetical protein COA99_14930 [Moraxellaceae bacterium]
MTLLAILIALFATRQAVVPEYFRELRWSGRYIAMSERVLFRDIFHPAVCYGFFVVPLVAICWFVGTYQTAWFYDAVDFAISIVLLVSIIGDRQLESAMQPFLKRWQAQEWQAAYVYGEKLFRYNKIASPSDMLSQTITLFLLRLNQVLFSPIFWYVIFGSAGLMMYLLTSIAALPPAARDGIQVESESWRKIAQEFLQALDGIPARFVALSIALLCLNRKAFVVAFRRYRATDREAEIVLKLATASGLGFSDLPSDQELLASEGSARVHSVQDLKGNVLIFWVISIALLSLFGLAW